MDIKDELYDEAVVYVRTTGKTRISSLQRQFRTGYNRTARLIEAMEREGVVSVPDSRGERKLLQDGRPVSPPARLPSRMRIEAFKPDCFSIYDADGLDPINVVMQDFGGSGRLIVECYGEAWATYFGAYGAGTLRTFLAGCDPGYVANRLNHKGGEYLLSIAKVVVAGMRPAD